MIRLSNRACTRAQMPLGFVGRTPGSAADALVGSSGLDDAEFVDEERVRGDPRGPGGPPHNFSRKIKWHYARIKVTEPIHD